MKIYFIILSNRGGNEFRSAAADTIFGLYNNNNLYGSRDLQYCV